MPLPPTTRTRLGARHAVITTESHVRTTLPGWTSSRVIVTVSPQMGAGFVQYVAEMEAGARAGAPPPGVERFVFVVDGGVTAEARGIGRVDLGYEGYLYAPPGALLALVATEATQLLIIDRHAISVPVGATPPAAIARSLADVPKLPFLGDPDARLQTLIPDDLGYDFGMNVFTFEPGACLPLVESHYMEHGLLFLQGGGIYRLEDDWYPVQEGDQLWMGPFCPQWFAAVGKEPARYLYYKNGNRHPLRDVTTVPGAE